MSTWWNEPLRALLGALQHGRHSAAPGILIDTDVVTVERCELPQAETEWTCASCRVPFSLLLDYRHPLRCSAGHVVCGHCAGRNAMVTPTSSWLPVWMNSLCATRVSPPDPPRPSFHGRCPLCPVDPAAVVEVKPCPVTRALVRHGDANALRWLLRFHTTLMNTAPLWRGRMHYEGTKGLLHRHACVLFAFQPWCTACWERMDASESRCPCVSTAPCWVPHDDSTVSHDAHWICATCAQRREPCRLCALPTTSAARRAQSEDRCARARADFLRTWTVRLQDCIDWARDMPVLPAGAADRSPLACSHCRHPFHTQPVAMQPFWTPSCDHLLCGHCVVTLQHASSSPCPVCRVDQGVVAASRLPVWRPHTTLLTYLLLAGTDTAADGDALVCALTQHELQLVGTEPCVACHRKAEVHTRAPRNHDALFPYPIHDEAESNDREPERPLLRLFGQHAEDDRVRAYQDLWPALDVHGTGTLVLNIDQWVQRRVDTKAVAWLYTGGSECLRLALDSMSSRHHGMSTIVFDAENRAIRLFLFVAYDGGLMEWTFARQTAHLRLWVPETEASVPFPPDSVTVPYPFNNEEPSVTLPLGCVLGCRCAQDPGAHATDDVIVTPLSGSVFWHVSVQHWKPRIHV